MANSFIKPEKVVAMGLGMLQRELLLPRLVTRLAESDFVGAKNDTVNIKVPARLAAREYGWRNNRASEITSDDVVELSIPVVLDKDPYSAVKITDEQLTLDIEDFATQVLAPQIRAVAEKLESYLATEMADANYHATINYDASDDFFDEVVVEARRILNVANVPAAGRVLVLGSNIEAAALKNSTIKQADTSGSDSVLREAVIARLGGFTIVGNCNSIGANSAYAFHPTAFGFANMAPKVPDGATMGASETYDGLAMRWIKDYDAPHLQDRSVVSSFCGTASIEDGRNDAGDLTSENVRAVEITFYPNS